MTEEEYKTIQTYGIITSSSGQRWFLLMDKPVDRLEWMNDNERVFLCIREHGLPERVIFNGYTLELEKGNLKVQEFDAFQEEEELDELQQITHNLFTNISP
jgi:hypothetical protein